jgi:hypothetical protein
MDTTCQYRNLNAAYHMGDIGKDDIQEIGCEGMDWIHVV